ncbi:hypothetical protein HW537_03940 [Asaia siamensis]
MRIKNHRQLWCTIAGVAGCIAASASAQSMPGSSMKVASEAITKQHDLCQHDAGRLWGLSICGPIMLVDPKTRTLYANRNTTEHDLRAEGSLFTGTLPPDVSIANTSIDWAGIRWIMVLLPLPSDMIARDTLLMHESYHRIQPVRLPPPKAALPDHLDTYDGRMLLRLEWRALALALRTNGDAQRSAICDALAFRKLRRGLTKDAAERENALEILEGIAEYTGKRLGAGSKAVPSTIDTLSTYDQRDGYVRSFAYASGPAYGLLLDRLSPAWREKVRPGSDLGGMLHRAIGNVGLPQVMSIRDRYGYADIQRQETAKADAHARQAVVWQSALVDGPVLRVPLMNMKIEFNPQTVFALPPSGTVYPTAIIRDNWGTLTVRQGVLISNDWKSASVTGPVTIQGNDYTGGGWLLKLSPGWILSNGSVRHR